MLHFSPKVIDESRIERTKFYLKCSLLKWIQGGRHSFMRLAAGSGEGPHLHMLTFSVTFAKALYS